MAITLLARIKRGYAGGYTQPLIVAIEIWKEEMKEDKWTRNSEQQIEIKIDDTKEEVCANRKPARTLRWRRITKIKPNPIGGGNNPGRSKDSTQKSENPGKSN